MLLVRYKCLLLLCFVSAITLVQAQEFIGYVKKFDTSAVAVFQAKVEVTESGKPAPVILKTYFDGSYKFTPGKSRRYTLHVSYPGYTDTTFTISSDKKGIPSPALVTTVLKKDGMRLLGTIKSKEEDFPIRGATISVKNIMTRKEERVTTGIDGYYNVKLEYETNYRISIDKRSEGVINRFKDTSFYISTVGFNQPLDYRLDISLEPTTETLTPYKDYKPVGSKATKPVIEIKTTTDTLSSKLTTGEFVNGAGYVEHQDSAESPQEAAVNLKAELEKVKKELAEIKLKTLQDSPTEQTDNRKKRKVRKSKKQYVDYTEIVIIRDDVSEEKSTSKKKEGKRKSQKKP